MGRLGLLALAFAATTLLADADRLNAQCSVTPLTACADISSGRSAIYINAGRVPESTRFRWKWWRASPLPPPLGSPETGVHDYAACVYDSSRLVAEMRIPGGEHWSRRTSSRGELLDYKVPGSRWKSKPPNGIYRMRLLTKGYVSALSLYGRGDLLPLPALPFSLPPSIIVQLVNTAGGCWEARYVTVQANTSFSLKSTQDAGVGAAPTATTTRPVPSPTPFPTRLPPTPVTRGDCWILCWNSSSWIQAAGITEGFCASYVEACSGSWGGVKQRLWYPNGDVNARRCLQKGKWECSARSDCYYAPCGPTTAHFGCPYFDVTISPGC